MTLFTLLTTIIAFGFILWLVNSLIPMEARIRQILNITVAVVLVIWICQCLGLWDSLSHVRVGHHSEASQTPAVSASA